MGLGFGRIFLKWTVTEALSIFAIVDELWISWLSRLSLIQLALYPKIKSILSIKFDLPDPLGPTTLVKFS